MPPKKPGRPGTKRSAPKKNYKSKKSTLKSSPKAEARGMNMTPVYVLAIMALLAVVVIMATNSGKSPVKDNVNAPGIKEEVKKHEENKNAAVETKKDTEPENTAEEKKDRIKDKDKGPGDEASKHEEAAQKEFQIYLVKYNSQTEKMSLAPVRRRISSSSPLAGALNELIKGPSKSEEKQGLLTAIPEELKLRSVQVIGKSAVLDFNAAIEENANGEILLTRIDQLVYTATQFEGVENVVIRVNGKQKKFLGGEGLSISGPLGRRGK